MLKLNLQEGLFINDGINHAFLIRTGSDKQMISIRNSKSSSSASFIRVFHIKQCLVTFILFKGLRRIISKRIQRINCITATNFRNELKFPTEYEQYHVTSDTASASVPGEQWVVLTCLLISGLAFAIRTFFGRKSTSMFEPEINCRPISKCRKKLQVDLFYSRNACGSAENWFNIDT